MDLMHWAQANITIREIESNFGRHDQRRWSVM